MNTPDEPLNHSDQAPEQQSSADQDSAAPAGQNPALNSSESISPGAPPSESTAISPGAESPHDTAQASKAAPAGFRTPSDAADPGTDETAPGHRPAPFSAMSQEDDAHSSENTENGGSSVSVGSSVDESAEPVDQPHLEEATPVTASDAPEEGGSEPIDALPVEAGTEAAADETGSLESTMADAAPSSAADVPGSDAGDHAAAEATPAASAPAEPAAAVSETAGPETAVSETAGPGAAQGEDEVPGGAFDGQTAMDFDRTWQRIEEAFEKKQPVTALVIDRVKGGLIVDIGMQGFVPASHVATGKVHDLERYIGRTLKLRITDLDRERQRVVLSSRLVQEDEHNRKKKETMQNLKVGLITDGVVRRLTDFGAFVDIGGVDGLLHVSEMSWSRVKHPKEVVSPGDKIKVKVLKIGEDRKKISLGMRQLLPDPWNGIENQFKVGDTVDGRVVRVAPFGAFVQVKDGVEAILPNSEVLARRARPEELPQVGDSVHAKIVELRPEARRMGLSVRRVQDDQERRDYQQHVQTQQTGARTTIGDLFGDMLSEWSDDKDKQDEEG